MNKITIFIALMDWNNGQWNDHWGQKPLGKQALNAVISSVNSDS